jgi:hypothetical protein
MNDVVNYLLMLYIARKTYIARASVYGVISSLYVILKGLEERRLGFPG